MFSENAYAKVNLSLLITGKREDGYHLLDTVMQTVSLYDTIKVYKNEESIISVICDNAVISGSDNICYKAASLFYEHTGINKGVTIEIIKRIPLAAGLGGGSADAAAVLRLLNKLYGEPLSYEKLCEIALLLGADVPFCIKGGTARVTGIGEHLEPVDSALQVYIVLIKEGIKNSTAQMYKEFDMKCDFSHNDTVEKMVNSLKQGDYKSFLNTVYNDFSLVSNYKEIENRLYQVGADAVSVSGSGPTVMGIFKSKEKADKAAEILSNEYSNVYSVKGV